MMTLFGGGVRRRASDTGVMRRYLSLGRRREEVKDVRVIGEKQEACRAKIAEIVRFSGGMWFYSGQHSRKREKTIKRWRQPGRCCHSSSF